MAVDPVPWFIQAPAEHSAESARTLAYQAIGGKEGLARSGDLEVTALDVPGGAVRVMPGAAGILNRGSGGSGQAYVGRVGAAVDVPIAATGSGSGRSDLIMFRVDDPQYGGALPTSDTDGPYIKIDVLSGVPGDTIRVQDVPGREADSAVTLARIDIPASTGTITAGMVKNVSQVANPLSQSVLRTYALSNEDTEILTVAGVSGEVWPNASSVAWGGVFIPEWATRVRVVTTWAGVLMPPGNSWGHVWTQLAGLGGGTPVETARVGWDSPNVSNNSRQAFIAADDIAVPAGLRGTSQRVSPKGRILGGTNPARPVLTSSSALVVQLEFYEG